MATPRPLVAVGLPAAGGDPRGPYLGAGDGEGLRRGRERERGPPGPVAGAGAGKMQVTLPKRPLLTGGLRWPRVRNGTPPPRINK